MKIVHVQFSTSKEFSSAMIRDICHSPFSHVDILLDDETTPGGYGLLGASNSPHAPYLKGNPNGVAVRPPDYQQFGIRRVADIPCPDATADRFQELVLSQLGKPFDGGAMKAMIGPVDCPINRDWREADAWFCSELVTWALEQAGLWEYDLLVPKNRVSPADLLLLLNPHMNTATFWERPAYIKPGPGEV